MVSEAFVRQMPKVELHVHIEGSIRPETVLKLARKNGITLPATTVEGLRDWYTFRDFKHFVEVYVAVTRCIRDADDLELIFREFLEGQADQNVLHTEATYTASTIEKHCGISWPDQLAAFRRARNAVADERGVTLSLILDIVRGADSPERATEVAQWVIGAHGDGVCALGLAGEEGRCSALEYREAFEMVTAAGIPIAPHAGETCGAESIWDALNAMPVARIGHGVRCVEDPKLVVELRNRQIPLEVCPTSNVRLKVFPSLAEHSLPVLLDEGLNVTINSDDPPMFGTTITEEYLRCAQEFGLTEDMLYSLVQNAANAAFVSPDAKRILRERIREAWPVEGADEE